MIGLSIENLPSREKAPLAGEASFTTKHIQE
jgi:hypothetical protein